MNPFLFILLTLGLTVVADKETVNSSFIGEINVIKYQSVSVLTDQSLDDRNGSRCEISSPLNKTIFNPEHDGKCFYNIDKVMMNESDGDWSIIGIDNKNQTMFKTDFKINVLEYPEHKYYLNLLSGSSAELTFGPDDAQYCQYTMPNSEKIVRQNGKCSVKIQKVSKVLHDGIWSVDVGVPTSMSRLHYVYTVIVHQLGDKNSGITTKYTKTTDTLEMSCALPISEMKSCKFIRSDGFTMFINKHIGVENYEYFTSENELQDKNVTYVECGIRIRNPNNFDNMPWKCFIVHEKNDKIIETGSWVQNKYYSEDDLADRFIHSVSNITAVIKDEINVLCEYSKPIAYCWFRSPNGTQFTLFESTNNSKYEYYGQGFGVGQCGIKIKSITPSDSGSWRCNVGKLTGESVDPIGNVKVTVIGSPFRPKVKEMIWTKGINVSCQMYDKSPLEYCRFIRPDGQGINPTAIRHLQRDFYPNDQVNLDIGLCEIKIVANILVNIGRWQCIAKPLDKDIEYSNDFYVYAHYWSYDERGANAFLWIIAVMGIIGLIVLIRLLMVRHTFGRRDRRSNVENQSYPPPYSFSAGDQNATVKNGNLS